MRKLFFLVIRTAFCDIRTERGFIYIFFKKSVTFFFL